MNSRMRECLEQATQERAERWGGRQMTARGLADTIERSAKDRGAGFSHVTLFRALEIATEEPGETPEAREAEG